MCGINGFNFSNPATLRRMHAATRHRGPDDEGFFETPEISLAHNRLSIIDLSPLGRQPMSTPDGRFTIVFNGEIYNYKDLRTELEQLGKKFVSQSDTEVLLRSFARWGREALTKLNGIFAFAIWDRDKKELTLVRDQLGVKPLYYFWDGRRLIFSSEIKAILEHQDLRREIDLDALNLYFRFLYVPGLRTMFAGISKLQAGHLLVFRNGGINISRWWNIKEGEYLTSYSAAKDKIKTLALSAVKQQLVSDRPLGVFLSGGIDSSAVLGMMRQFVSGTIKTFSVGYEQTPEAEKYNADFELAARTAKHFGTEHQPLIISGRDVVECFEKIAWQMDEPVSNHIQPSTYLLAKFAKPQITVALGGDGGDELFGGYDRYWYSALIDKMRVIPAVFRPSWLVGVVEQLAGKSGLKEKVALSPGVERFLAFMNQKEERVAAILRSEVNRPNAAREHFAPYFDPLWKDFTNQFMAVDTQTWLSDESLVRTDKMTMAWGLEQRVPLLDPRLVELSVHVPSKWKLDSRTLGKRILRDALKPYIPDFVIREKKRGFFSPASKWLRGDLLPMAKELLSDSYAPGSKQYINLAAARTILEDHVALRRYGLTQIWSLLTFQSWYRNSFRA